MVQICGILIVMMHKKAHRRKKISNCQKWVLRKSRAILKNAHYWMRPRRVCLFVQSVTNWSKLHSNAKDTNVSSCCARNAFFRWRLLMMLNFAQLATTTSSPSPLEGFLLRCSLRKWLSVRYATGLTNIKIWSTIYKTAKEGKLIANHVAWKSMPKWLKIIFRNAVCQSYKLADTVINLWTPQKSKKYKESTFAKAAKSRGIWETTNQKQVKTSLTLLSSMKTMKSLRSPQKCLQVMMVTSVIGNKAKLFMELILYLMNRKFSMQRARHGRRRSRP